MILDTLPDLEGYELHLFHGNRFTRRLAYALKAMLRCFSFEQPLTVFADPRNESSSRIEAVYIINLDRQPSRWEDFKREARRHVVDAGLPLLDFCHRVPAIDGKVLGTSDANGAVCSTYPLENQFYVDPDPRLLSLIRDRAVSISMSREEIAVALSHISAWRRLVSENRSYALILEDDVFFESGFAEQFNRTWHELPNDRDSGNPQFDLLYVSFREVERGAQHVICSQHVRRPLKGYWWLSGYVLSNAGARKLLQLLPVTGPVDLWMNHRFVDLDVYSTPRSLISQRTDLPSDNRYSILPLLTQIGVQTDKSHLLLEQTRGRRPVFCIGFGQSSAAVLESALSLLGYRCCNDRWGQFSEIIRTLLDDKRPLLFDAYIGIDRLSEHLAPIREMYPDAVFILPPVPEEVSGVSLDDYSNAKAVLQGNGEVLLHFDVRCSSNWHGLCKFLRCKLPPYPFPAQAPVDGIQSHPIRDFQRISTSARNLVVLEHDVHPWIVPYERMSAFGGLRGPRDFGTPVGTFQLLADDWFASLDDSMWAPLVDTFPSNLADFSPQNVSIVQPAGCRMTLSASSGGDREYVAASFRSRESYRYGRFEVSLKPACVSGVVTAFFLHRNDPWQEIDIEFLGSDTTKVLLNVYFNPGLPGTKCNFGNRGTPIVVDLPFDAAESFHSYAIEWEPHEVRWFVDEALVHVRACWEPTPIPDLPMSLFSSVWPPRSSELAGVLRPSDLPVASDLRRIRLWKWCGITSTDFQEGRESQDVISGSEWRGDCLGLPL